LRDVWEFLWEVPKDWIALEMEEQDLRLEEEDSCLLDKSNTSQISFTSNIGKDTIFP